MQGALSNFEEPQQIKDDELSKELGRIDDALVLLEHDAARVQKSADAEEMRTSVPASRRKKEDRFYLQLRSPANMMLSTNREGARLLGQRYQKRKVGSFKKTLLIHC